jgi:hypothetical protein
MRSTLVAAAMLGLCACAADAPAPTDPTVQPDLRPSAFTLQIDGRTGRIIVAPPQSVTRTDGGVRLMNSLLGGDALAVSATDCVFSPVPGNTKRRRCTFSITLTNRLTVTDLVAPATFPKPPVATDGILVFPYTAAGLSDIGGTALANADWDRAPANFFNDFGGCTTARYNDCYRSEPFPTLYAGSRSLPRQVGFDIDADAVSVSAYLVVAADLRDNPLQTVTIQSVDADDGTLYGRLTTGGTGTSCCGAAAGIYVGQANLATEFGAVDPGLARGFLRFGLGALPAASDIVGATLRVQQLSAGLQASADPYQLLGNVVVDHMDFGATIEAGDFQLVAIAPATATLSTNNTAELKSTDVTALVRADLSAGRTRTDVRLRFNAEVLGTPAEAYRGTFFGETSGLISAQGPRPELVLTYRKK